MSDRVVVLAYSRFLLDCSRPYLTQAKDANSDKDAIIW